MRRKNNSVSFFNIYIVVTLIGILLISVLSITSLQKKEPNIYKKLSFTQSPILYYTEPIIFNLSNKNVLGAQTLDPRDIITYVNEERLKRGAPALRVNPTLTKAAQMRADIILKYENFSHQDPFEHIQLDTILPLLHYTFAFASENIGMGDSSSKEFVNGFMHSPSHRDNLLNPKLTQTGVAIVTGPYKQYYVNIAVQLFAIPASEEQYLGYTNINIEEQNNLIEELKTQLTQVKNVVGTSDNRKTYYQNWEKLLVRQLEIASYIYEAMKKRTPLNNNFATLITEYNQNIDFIRKLQRS